RAARGRTGGRLVRGQRWVYHENCAYRRDRRVHRQDGGCAAGPGEDTVPDAQRAVRKVRRDALWPVQGGRGDIPRLRHPRPVPGPLDAAGQDIPVRGSQVYDLRAAQGWPRQTRGRRAHPQLSGGLALRRHQPLRQLPPRHDPRADGVPDPSGWRACRARVDGCAEHLLRAGPSAGRAELFPRLPALAHGDHPVRRRVVSDARVPDIAGPGKVCGACCGARERAARQRSPPPPPPQDTRAEEVGRAGCGRRVWHGSADGILSVRAGPAADANRRRPQPVRAGAGNACYPRCVGWRRRPGVLCWADDRVCKGRPDVCRV
ncbi:hypothetical protein H4R21_006292, partial [Coemansia helicoidea]